jgi:PQQ-dependent dehydrogenase, methanol/ethanol family
MKSADRSITHARVCAFLAALVIPITACQRQSEPSASTATVPKRPVDQARLEAADSDAANWLTTGRTYSEQRFSPLIQINDQNVGQLRLAWHHDLDAIPRGQESTPLVVDGVMYVSTTWSKVFALDARTGKLLWEYDPKVPGEWGINACCDVVNRGVAFWKDKVYLGTLDGRLVALDAATGTPVWETQTVDRSQRYAITGAPRVIRNKVIIGNAGSEFGVRGYISAYDADTGELVWRFYTVPGEPGKKDGAASDEVLEKIARPTWTGEWWKLGGGGTVWDAMAYDPELDLLYFGTGNGTPWSHTLRSPDGGDNLFLASIIAVKAETGEYVWHFQTVPGEDWDYDSTNHIILADLEIDGRKRKVLMQAPKNGVFYVLDRETGEFVSAKPYVNINWATGFDPKTGRPIENPEARYGRTGKPFVARPGPAGGHAWQPMSFNPLTGLVYIPALDLAMPFGMKRDERTSRYAFNVGFDFLGASLPQDPKIKAEAKATSVGYLVAWDPVSQQAAWRVQYSDAWRSGVLSTAGNLVFQGTAMGELQAFAADTGERLWSAPTQSGIVAAPITYEVDGEQFVAVVTGWGGAFAIAAGEIAREKRAPLNTPRVLAFSLKGNDTLPDPPEIPRPTLQPPPNTASAATIARGRELFHPYCSNCHGDAAVSGSFIPDLRNSPLLADAAAWRSVVHDGALRERGMVSFSAELSPEDVEAIRAYVISRAHDALAERSAGGASAP